MRFRVVRSRSLSRRQLALKAITACGKQWKRRRWQAISPQTALRGLFGSLNDIDQRLMSNRSFWRRQDHTRFVAWSAASGTQHEDHFPAHPRARAAQSESG